jgi:murein L,D-transpeptidase YcbB/YkuD
MKRLHTFFIVFLLILSACSKDEKQQENKKGNAIFTGLFEKKIEPENTDSLSVEKFLTANKEFEPHRKKIHKFYSRRNYSLAWSNEGEFLPQASMFINLMNDIQNHGINSYKDYNLREKYVETSEAKKRHREEIAQMRKDLDILLTSSYFQYAQDIWRGTVDPAEENIGWYVDRKKIKYGKTLDVILSNTKNENPFLLNEPLHPEYQKLKNLLSEYKKVDSLGGWPQIKIEKNKKIKLGDTSAIVSTLKKRLLLSHDVSEANSDSIYDSKVESAVKRFQQRHGLKEDGVLDTKTLHALNIPIQERIEQIIINMERWRWVPKRISENYVMVNIPEYKLHVFENGKEIWDMNVIVGKRGSQTPIFNDIIEYIVMSPTWNIPPSIAKDEIIPLVQKDPLNLAKFNMQVLEKNEPIDPSSVNWANLNEDEIKKYSFKQNPGAGNALGLVKFIFPNEYDVYLHDTPTNKLFSQTERGFSHGCIRIQDPLKFAEYLLKNEPNWNKEKISNAMNSGQEQYVKLKKKEPVYIVYFTVWVDNKGVTHFRDDIYGHDKKLAQAFYER